MTERSSIDVTEKQTFIKQYLNNKRQKGQRYDTLDV